MIALGGISLTANRTFSSDLIFEVLGAVRAPSCNVATQCAMSARAGRRAASHTCARIDNMNACSRASGAMLRYTR
jgi:hypothetical protein